MLAGLLAAACAPAPSPTAEPPAAIGDPTPAPARRVGTVSPTTPTPAPTPAPTPSPMPAGTYLALGDSLAVGVGASRPDELGYVALLHGALSGGGEPGRDPAAPRLRVLRNLAVSGETSASFISGGQLDAAREAIAGAAPPVALVTLDIGGNDLLALLRTEACASTPDGLACAELVAQTLAAFEANYRVIVGALGEALRASAPDARLAVMTYFDPFSGTDAAYEAAAELALLGADGRVDCDAAAADPALRGMNDIVACVAREAGAVAIDVGPLFAGLGLELTHIGTEDIHANDRGYEVIAEAFVEALGGPVGARPTP